MGYDNPSQNKDEIIEGLEPLGPTDMIVISVMDKVNGLYEVMMVTNGSRWKKDRCNLHEGSLVHIDVTKIGRFGQVISYHSIEEFEEEEYQ